MAIAFSVYLAATIGMNYGTQSAAKLEHIWKQDIQNLLKAEKLPSYWKDIRLVEKVAARDDLLAESWSKFVSSPVEINPSGEYKLEILFLSQKEGRHERAVIQHHMIHIPTGNSVWELGRTYILN